MKSNLLFVVLLAPIVTGFSPVHPGLVNSNKRILSPRVILFNGNSADNQKNMNNEVTTDWDAEFIKHQKAPKDPNRPRGIEFNEVEFKKEMMKRDAKKLFSKVVPDVTAIEVPQLSWNKLKDDWRFWAGLIAIISLLPVLFNAIAPPLTYEYVVLGSQSSDVFLPGIDTTFLTEGGGPHVA